MIVLYVDLEEKNLTAPPTATFAPGSVQQQQQQQQQAPPQLQQMQMGQMGQIGQMGQVQPQVRGAFQGVSMAAMWDANIVLRETDNRDDGQSARAALLIVRLPYFSFPIFPCSPPSLRRLNEEVERLLLAEFLFLFLTFFLLPASLFCSLLGAVSLVVVLSPQLPIATTR
jgi:hypothetical protein